MMTDEQILKALQMRSAGNPAGLIAEKLGVTKEEVKHHLELVDREEEGEE